MTSIIKTMYKKGTITASISGADVSNLSVEQYGKVVVLNGFIRSISFTANTEKELFTISGVDLPPSAVRAVVGVANNPYDTPTASYGAISVSGAVVVRTSLSGSKSVIFSISYIA